MLEVSGLGKTCSSDGTFGVVESSWLSDVLTVSWVADGTWLDIFGHEDESAALDETRLRDFESFFEIDYGQDVTHKSDDLPRIERVCIGSLNDDHLRTTLR